MHKPDKGFFNGSCNRTACQGPEATFFNTSTRAYYCAKCAHTLNRVNGDPTLCVPQGHILHPMTA